MSLFWEMGLYSIVQQTSSSVSCNFWSVKNKKEWDRFFIASSHKLSICFYDHVLFSILVKVFIWRLIKF